MSVVTLVVAMAGGWLEWAGIGLTRQFYPYSPTPLYPPFPSSPARIWAVFAPRQMYLPRIGIDPRAFVRDVFGLFSPVCCGYRVYSRLSPCFVAIAIYSYV